MKTLKDEMQENISNTLEIMDMFADNNNSLYDSTVEDILIIYLSRLEEC